MGPMAKKMKTRNSHGENDDAVHPTQHNDAMKTGRQLKNNTRTNNKRSDVWRTVNSSSDDNSSEVYFASNEEDDEIDEDIETMSSKMQNRRMKNIAI